MLDPYIFSNFFLLEENYFLGIELPLSDTDYILKEISKYSQKNQYQTFYHDRSLNYLLELSTFRDNIYVKPTQTTIDNPLKYLLNSGSNLEDKTKNGKQLYILDCLDYRGLSKHEYYELELSLINVYRLLKWNNIPYKIIFLQQADYLSATARNCFYAQLKISLPEDREIENILLDYYPQGVSSKTVAAAKALSRGDITKIAETRVDEAKLQAEFLVRKETVLKSLEVPLEYFSDCIVNRVAGSSKLTDFLFNRLQKLIAPRARAYDIDLPRAMLMVGPPGTGKTLMAKQVADKLGYTLIGLSLGNVLTCDNPEAALNEVLAVAEALDTTVLYLDDFDKGFVGFEEGGVSRRIAQKFLTWMQEHDSRVFTIATCNRIELLPAESLRRFDSGGIWLIDIPREGDIFEILILYLQKKFPQQFLAGDYYQFESEHNPWSFEQWQRIILEAKGCTPVELADTVIQAHQDWYVEDGCNTNSQVPYLKPEVLIQKFRTMVKASYRASEQFAAMRNNAFFAIDAAGPDTSVFAQDLNIPLYG